MPKKVGTVHLKCAPTKGSSPGMAGTEADLSIASVKASPGKARRRPTEETDLLHPLPSEQ